jgi:hypothetical protein
MIEKPKPKCEMRSLASHAAFLAEALAGIGGQNCELDDVSSYLQLASGVQRVEFNTFQFDSMAGFCESADSYREDQDKLWSALATRLSVFLFTWAAVEAYKDNLHLLSPASTPGKKQRQIDKLCYYLVTNYRHPLPEKYSDLLNCFKMVARKARVGRGAAVATTLPTYMQPVGEGLYLVYEFRNAFAHGDFEPPPPDGDGDNKRHPDVMIVALATRIVLMTLQMLTLCHYPPNEIVEATCFDRWLRSSKPLTVNEVFLDLHKNF